MAAAGSGHSDVLCLLLAWGVAVDVGKYPLVTLEKKQLLNIYGRELGINWLSCTAK
jgi:hypothetical protein